jgi:hypothetical protein
MASVMKMKELSADLKRKNLPMLQANMKMPEEINVYFA